MFLALLNVLEKDVILEFPVCTYMRKDTGVPDGGGGSSSAAAAKLFGCIQAWGYSWLCLLLFCFYGPRSPSTGAGVTSSLLGSRKDAWGYCLKKLSLVDVPTCCT